MLIVLEYTVLIFCKLHPESITIVPFILYALSVLISFKTSKPCVGDVFPIPTLPDASIIIFEVLFVTNTIVSSSFAFTNALRCVLITPPNDPHVLPGPYPSNVDNSVLYLIIPVLEVDGRVAVLPTGIVNPLPLITTFEVNVALPRIVALLILFKLHPESIILTPLRLYVDVVLIVPLTSNANLGFIFCIPMLLLCIINADLFVCTLLLYAPIPNNTDPSAKLDVPNVKPLLKSLKLAPL